MIGNVSWYFLLTHYSKIYKWANRTGFFGMKILMCLRLMHSTVYITETFKRASFPDLSWKIKLKRMVSTHWLSSIPGRQTEQRRMFLQDSQKTSDPWPNVREGKGGSRFASIQKPLRNDNLGCEITAVRCQYHLRVKQSSVMKTRLRCWLHSQKTQEQNHFHCRSCFTCTKEQGFWTLNK